MHKTKPDKTKMGDGKKVLMPFGKTNNKLLLIGLVFIVLGFILMIGGGTENPNEFSPAIFDFQRLTLSPILLMIGFIIEIFAIMLQPKEQ